MLEAQGRPVAAARLLGAMEKLTEMIGSPLAPNSQHDRRRIAGAMRAQVGEGVLARALEAGHALTLDQALADVLVEGEEPSAHPPAPSHVVEALLTAPHGPLTPREAEVARLLIAGYSDRQIAASLAISTRTASVHVRHLMAKLGYHSRWQVADWAQAHGLDAVSAE